MMDYIFSFSIKNTSLDIIYKGVKMFISSLKYDEKAYLLHRSLKITRKKLPPSKE